MGAIDAERLRGAAIALLAAALFGVSAPLAKLLVAIADPLVLAGLLYVGGGLALCLPDLVPSRGRATARAAEAALRASDMPVLALITVVGGIVAPLSMLAGLSRVSGVAGSLLLNLEAPFTIILAVGLFGEHIGRREALASAVIVTGAAWLAWAPGELHADVTGALFLAGACALWGLDNNLVQRLTLRDPLAIARAKALGAGTAMLLVAVVLGRTLPDGTTTLAALAVGAAGYGFSIALDAYALRILGAAREAAFFATAPFLGALAAVPLLSESLGAPELTAGGLMVAGVLVLLRVRHEHEHAHEPVLHEHRHSHDEHHRHDHAADDPPGEPHSHEHRHASLRHSHPHVSDAHHRHVHGR